MTADGGYEKSDAERDEQYGVVNGHNTRCASLLGQGCDCRDPFGEDPLRGQDDGPASREASPRARERQRQALKADSTRQVSTGPEGLTFDSRPRLTVVPVTLREANAFVDQHHRHHEGNAKHRVSAGVVDESGAMRGVAIMARPKARNLPQYAVAEVVRLATDGCANACSALYGACCRIGDAIGYCKVITYTLLSEPGTSLRAAGWKPTAVTDGGSWDRVGRPRTDSHPLDRKIRWECRHSDAPAIDIEAVRAA